MRERSLQRDLGKSAPFDSPEQEAFLNLIRTASMLAGEFDALFKAHGLSQPKYNVLRILRGHGGPIPSLSIAGEMVTRVPDVTRILDRLEASGYVERQRSDTDRRVVLVSITQQGLEKLDTLEEPVRDLHKKQLGHMPASDLGLLSELHERVRQK